MATEGHWPNGGEQSATAVSSLETEELPSDELSSSSNSKVPEIPGPSSVRSD